MNKISPIVLLVLLLIAPLVANADKQAKCIITSHKTVVFNDKCLFMPEENGTFSLSNLNKNTPLYGDITLVTVAVIKGGVAEVRGLTTTGINSRWGNASRSTKDKSCWVGSDFRICAK